jgi:hypothetical protein
LIAVYIAFSVPLKGRLERQVNRWFEPLNHWLTRRRMRAIIRSKLIKAGIEV